MDLTFIVISHNHQSRDIYSSSSDISLTRKLAKACKNVGIELIDHIIIIFKVILILRRICYCESFYSYSFNNVLKEGMNQKKLLDKFRHSPIIKL
ncbi:MAG: JAB domain-containing protein [Wolbachia sp.]